MVYWTRERVVELREKEEQAIRRYYSWYTGLTLGAPVLATLSGAVWFISTELGVLISVVLGGLCFGIPVGGGFVLTYLFMRKNQPHPASFVLTSLAASLGIFLLWSIVLCMIGARMFPIL